MSRIFSRVQMNPHRQSLDNLHVVAGGVFGRQKTEEFAGSARQALDVTFVITSRRVHMHGHGLAAMHPAHCVSRKSAVIQMRLSGTTVSSCSPGCTR